MHALRHTLASQAIEYGIDVVELHNIPRHASVATSCRYPVERLREAIALTPPNTP